MFNNRSPISLTEILFPIEMINIGNNNINPFLEVLLLLIIMMIIIMFSRTRNYIIEGIYRSSSSST